MENHLEHVADFQKILSGYRIAPAGQKVLASTKLALLFGASATGRDTVIRALAKTGDFFHLVSDTTRHPRVNNGVLERNGVEYWFRAEDELLEDLRAGKLLEAEIIHGQQVSGISIRELAKAAKLGKIPITNVDLNIKNIVQVKPDTFAFAVVPPTFEEWMKRLSGRGTLSAEEKSRRLATAVHIFEAALTWPFFEFVVSERVEKSVRQIRKRCLSGKTDPAEQAHGRAVTEKLLAEIRRALQ